MWLLHQHETRTSLGRSTVIDTVMLSFEHMLSGPSPKGRRSVRDFKFQSCSASVARSSNAQAGCVIAHMDGASEGYRTPAVHSRSVRDVVSFGRLDHVSKQH